jgi:hypothetical protein
MPDFKKQYQDMLIKDIGDHLTGLNDLFLSPEPDLEWVDYHYSRATTKLKILQEVFSDGV